MVITFGANAGGAGAKPLLGSANTVQCHGQDRLGQVQVRLGYGYGQVRLGQVRLGQVWVNLGQVRFRFGFRFELVLGQVCVRHILRRAVYVGEQGNAYLDMLYMCQDRLVHILRRAVYVGEQGQARYRCICGSPVIQHKGLAIQEYIVRKSLAQKVSATIQTGLGKD